MSFFRSALLRRIIYAIVLALALTRLAGRSHSEPLQEGLPFTAATLGAEAGSPAQL
jgi:hypothetical protein